MDRYPRLLPPPGSRRARERLGRSSLCFCDRGRAWPIGTPLEATWGPCSERAETDYMRSNSMLGLGLSLVDPGAHSRARRARSLHRQSRVVKESAPMQLFRGTRRQVESSTWQSLWLASEAA